MISTTRQATRRKRISAEDVKRAAQAQGWKSLLAADIEADLLDGKDHPCPKCGGIDRFSAFKDFEQTGGVGCRHCQPGTGDGIGTVAWLKEISQAAAIEELGERLGLSGGVYEQDSVDIIAEVARDKQMPLEAFKLLNPKPYLKGRGKQFSARLPVYDERLELSGYFDIEPGTKGKFSRGSTHGLFMVHADGKPVAPKAGDIVPLCEGCKDQSALIGLGYNAIGLPSSYMDPRFAPLFKGCHVVIVPDLDEPAQIGSYKTGGNLRGIAASIKVARLPGEIRASKGDDVRDVLKRPNGEQLVRNAIDNAEDWQPREGEHDPKDGRPEVYVTLCEGAVADQVVKALGRLGWESPWLPVAIREHVKVYQRGGQLVAAIKSEDPNSPAKTLTIFPLPLPLIRERITQACQLLQEREKEGELEIVAVQPPKWLQDVIYQRGWYGTDIRSLAGIIQSPTLRKDGSILQTPGWDKSTGLLYNPLIDFPKVPSQPTLEDAQKALRDLLEVICDFPFQDDSDRAAWVCMLLTMLGRECIDGSVPLFAVTANTPGSGKGMCVDAASVIAYGKDLPKESFDSDGAEQRKLITTHAIEGSRAVVFDNVESRLGGVALDAALTARSWKDRILGSSKSTGDLPMRTIWIATGNNLTFGSDLARRVLPIRLQSPVESPEDRTDFRHSNLLAWTAENRPRLVMAALTILRAYFVAGKPNQPGGDWGSFSEWSEVVRDAVMWAGGDDPLKTRQTAKADDTSGSVIRALIGGLLEMTDDAVGITTREIVAALNDHHNSDRFPTMREVVAEVATVRNVTDSKRLGYVLRKYQGRVANGWQITSRDGHGGVKRWSASRAVCGGDGGDGGDVSLPSHGEKVVCSTDTRTHAHTHTFESGGALELSPPSQPSPPCPTCGAGLTSTPAEPGWVNWDCHSCGYVKPAKVTA